MQEEPLPRQVKVVAHDPNWKIMYRQEAERISLVLEENVAAIHHIGSTAIPGIFAKPIIDILLEVKELPWLDGNTAAMERLGYESMGEYGLPGRRYFRKENLSGIRTYQVHAYQAGNPEILRHLAFRDFMLSKPLEAQRYSNLKIRLAQEHPDDIDAYMDGKDAYLKEQEARALVWRSLDPEK